MPTIIPIHYGHSCSTPEQDAQIWKLLSGGLLMLTLIVLVCHILCFIKYRYQKKQDIKHHNYFNYRSYHDYLSYKYDILEGSTFILLFIYALIFIFAGGYYLINLFY